MKNSHIEWTDHTFNPWEGCTKVSPGCANCYAENRNSRFAGGKAPNWGKGAPRRRTSADYWKEPLKWNRAAAESGTRPRVFCASLADVFDDEVPEEWRIDLWTLISETKHLDWLLLTKRPQNIRDMIPWSDKPSLRGTSAGVDYWSHVWLGTSVENQDQVSRVFELLQAPASVHFLSCEPLLSALDLPLWRCLNCHNPCTVVLVNNDKDYGCSECKHLVSTVGVNNKPGYPLQQAGIDWVIAGGESGPKARPMHPEWARSLRDQCRAAGVSFLFKQWGEFTPVMDDLNRYYDGGSNPAFNQAIQKMARAHGASDIFEPRSEASTDAPCFDYSRCPTNFMPDLGKGVHEHMARVGKKRAGRLLDGRTWDEVPTRNRLP